MCMTEVIVPSFTHVYSHLLVERTSGQLERKLAYLRTEDLEWKIRREYTTRVMF